jgi:ornithine decarboxylase
MAIDILPATVDISVSHSPKLSSFKAQSWISDTIWKRFRSVAAVVQRNAVPVPGPEEPLEDAPLFPELPALLTGHTDVHLRNGIMDASRLAATGVPDAEKAFFVADLSVVYRQHQRWKQCLPEIEPFYGAISSSVTRDGWLIRRF